jgi:MarR family transcriptional regulator, organic hydroperoxide resistance regulator
MTDFKDQEAGDLALDSQLCFAVYSAAHAFTRLYSVLLDGHGLTYTQYLVLLVLWEGDGLTVKELGARLRLDSGTLTPVLRRLENQGHVTRERDTSDQRRVHVHLTRCGRELQPRIADIRRVVFHATGLGAQDLASLKRQLEDVAAALDSTTEHLDSTRGHAVHSRG